MLSRPGLRASSLTAGDPKQKPSIRRYTLMMNKSKVNIMEELGLPDPFIPLAGGRVERCSRRRRECPECDDIT